MPKDVAVLPLPCFSYLGIPNPNITEHTPPQIAAELNAKSKAIAAAIPRIGLVDMCYMPKAGLEFGMVAFSIVYYIPTLILFIIYRKHVLIKYRQPTIVIIQSILGIIMSLLVPIFRYFETLCLLTTWIINPLTFSRSILTYSRYVRVYFMQKLSIFKLKFSEKKKSKKYKRNELVSIKSRDVSLEISDDTSSKVSTLSNNEISDNARIEDPVLYFKKLDKVINNKIFLILVIIPTIFIIVYSIILTIKKWDDMKSSCPNEDKSVGAPKLILCICIILSSIFLLYQAYYKQKWDIEIKIEYTLYVVVMIICTILLQLTVNECLSDIFIRNRSYIFYFLTAVVHALTVIEPLIKIFFYKLKKDDQRKLSEEEFLEKLNNVVFKAQVKEIATNTFCIENVLFFDAHLELMNTIINYYGKKNLLVPNEPTTYSSSDVLRKSMINQALYRPFEECFKPQFDQIYNLYINEDGIASVNIKASTIRTIKEQMESNEYTYLMFSQAAEEIGELLYSNIYPRMKNYK